MPRGPGPDWNRGESQMGAPVADLGEVAARITKGLSGPYRGGRVLFSTAFDGTIADIQQFIGGGAIAYDNTRADIGAGSCKLTTNPTQNSTTYIYRYLPGIFASKIGMEFSFWSNDGYANKKLTLQYEANYPDTRRDMAWVVMNLNNGAITGSVGSSALPSMPGIAENNGFCTVKLTADMRVKGAPKHGRLMINDTVYDFSGVDGFSETGVTGTYHPMVVMTLTLTNTVAAAKSINVGRYILTADEVY